MWDFWFALHMRMRVLGKLVNASKSQCSHLENGGNESAGIRKFGSVRCGETAESLMYRGGTQQMLAVPSRRNYQALVPNSSLI